ncbi:MAG: hypothetical protein IKD01_06190 [Oscillospiraceae bacterium]|nr:hypothetical protein [Oscillospiraceae bacterium]
MAGKLIRMHTDKCIEAETFFEALNRLNCYGDVEEVSRVGKRFRDAEVYFIVYEKYFMRVESYVSLSILFTKTDLRSSVELVSSGGGDGLLNISWGAENSFANDCAEVLESLGFCREEEPEAEEKSKSFFGRLFK